LLTDLGASEGRLWVVESNGSSGSWLDACDPAAVVAAAVELAAQAWEGNRA
jgi:hypothetical protein